MRLVVVISMTAEAIKAENEHLTTQLGQRVVNCRAMRVVKII